MEFQPFPKIARLSREVVITEKDVDTALESLRINGSYAVPGFDRPEGVVVYHTASRTLFKKTLEKDQEPKSAAMQEAA
jgi:hypothetical protein